MKICGPGDRIRLVVCRAGLYLLHDTRRVFWFT